MNHDKLRQQAEATLSNAGSPREYILAEAVLALLDENAALRDLVIDAKVMITASWLIAENGPAWMERAKRVLALGDAS